MTATDLDYQAILDRIVAIMQADSTIYTATGTMIRQIVTGTVEKGKYPMPYAYVTIQRVNDTFYDSASLTSNYELFIMIAVFDSKKDGAKLESSLLAFAKAIKLAIKNNTKLYTPSTTSDAKVTRAWPIRLEKAQGFNQQTGDYTGGIWITVRATHYS